MTDIFREGTTKNLLELSQEYDVVLMDSSAFCEPLPQRNRDRVAPNLLRENRKVLRYLEEMQELVENDCPLYVTSGVFNECTNKGSFRYIKLIKRPYMQCHADARLSARIKRDLIKKRRKVCDILHESGGVIDFRNRNFRDYEGALETIGDLKPLYGAGDADLELLATGAAISMDGVSVAILSNDIRHVKRGHVFLLRRNPKIDPERFRFYKMVKQGEFYEVEWRFAGSLDRTG